MSTTIAAVAAGFGHDLAFDLVRVETIIRHARQRQVRLLVLPDAALGGYCGGPRPDEAPALEAGDPALARVREMAGEMVVCVGYCERVGDRRFRTAVALCGDGVLGRHRQVHPAPGAPRTQSAGRGFRAFDSPVGRIGLLVDHDKSFPESARSLAVDGAETICCLSAWPTSITNRAPRMGDDPQSRLFDLYDRARAAENQVVLVSSNLTGTVAGLRFLGQAKVVGPGGDLLARSWGKAGLAVATLDVRAEVELARQRLHLLGERRLQAYG